MGTTDHQPEVRVKLQEIMKEAVYYKKDTKSTMSIHESQHSTRSKRKLVKSNLYKHKNVTENNLLSVDADYDDVKKLLPDQ